MLSVISIYLAKRMFLLPAPATVNTAVEDICLVIIVGVILDPPPSLPPHVGSAITLFAFLAHRCGPRRPYHLSREEGVMGERTIPVLALPSPCILANSSLIFIPHDFPLTIRWISSLGSDLPPPSLHTDLPAPPNLNTKHRAPPLPLGLRALLLFTQEPLLLFQLRGALGGRCPRHRRRRRRGMGVIVGGFIVDGCAEGILSLKIEQFVTVFDCVVETLTSLRSGRRFLHGGIPRCLPRRAALLTQGCYHRLDLRWGEQWSGAEGAGSETFFHADDFAAGEAVGGGEEEGVPRCIAGA